MKTKLSKITCIADYRLAPAIENVLSEMKIPEVLLQRGKQVSVLERSSFLRTALLEARSDFWRLNVPIQYEKTIARKIAHAADLYLPGRGTLIAEDVCLESNSVPVFDEEVLVSDKDVFNKDGQPYTVVCCIVMRGMGDSIARTILEMGLCVPAVSFGQGMGLRNKLGLLRITIAVDKELLYFVVPERDADLLEGVIVHKAKLDRPGQGITFRYPVRAYAVNLRMRTGKRQHAASIEQIISALDDMRGSSDWRRLGASSHSTELPKNNSALERSCITIIAEQGSVVPFVNAAMDLGAGGATLLELSRRSYSNQEIDKSRNVSNAREACDLVIPKSIVEPIRNKLIENGLLNDEFHGSLEISSIDESITYVEQR